MADYGQNAVQVGDVLLFHGELDTGDISVKDGFVEMTALFDTMAYLCRFGGNHDDDASPSADKKQWWGNEGEEPENQYRCRTQAHLNGEPMTSARLRTFQEDAKADIEDAFIGGGFADSVDTTVRLISPKRIEISDKIYLKSGDELRNRIEVSI